MTTSGCYPVRMFFARWNMHWVRDNPMSPIGTKPPRMYRIVGCLILFFAICPVALYWHKILILNRPTVELSSNLKFNFRIDLFIVGYQLIGGNLINAMIGNFTHTRLVYSQ
jgi:hypothetical protein